jgi:hypothetical protein
MTTKMIDAVTVTEAKIYKGAARVVISDPDEFTSFPGAFDTVMDPTTYELQSGLSDLGPTTEDGVAIRRTADLSDGIPLDQRETALYEGEPERWSMEAEVTFLHTDLDTIQIAWEGGTKRTIASPTAQHSLDLDAPSTFTERMVFVIQESAKTEKLRMHAYRKAVPQVDGSEMAIKGSEATGLPTKFKLRADENVAQGSGQFGKIFEID